MAIKFKSVDSTEKSIIYNNEVIGHIIYYKEPTVNSWKLTVSGKQYNLNTYNLNEAKKRTLVVLKRDFNINSGKRKNPFLSSMVGAIGSEIGTHLVRSHIDKLMPIKKRKTKKRKNSSYPTGKTEFKNPGYPVGKTDGFFPVRINSGKLEIKVPNRNPGTLRQAQAIAKSFNGKYNFNPKKKKLKSFTDDYNNHSPGLKILYKGKLVTIVGKERFQTPNGKWKTRYYFE